MSDTDRIEKQIVLKAPRSRVWRAITTPEEFGRWFRADVSGPFSAGGTQLTIVESGFDGIPLTRRLEASRGNRGGWDQQAENIARHVRESL